LDAPLADLNTFLGTLELAGLGDVTALFKDYLRFVGCNTLAEHVGFGDMTGFCMKLVFSLACTSLLKSTDLRLKGVNAVIFCLKVVDIVFGDESCDSTRSLFISTAAYFGEMPSWILSPFSSRANFLSSLFSFCFFSKCFI